MSNFEGRMKEKKRISPLRFMGSCFSAHDKSLQPDPYQHFEPLPKNVHVSNLPQVGDLHVASRWSPVSTSSSVEACQPEVPGNKSPNFSNTPKDVTELRMCPKYGLCDVFTFDELKLATKYFRPDLILGEGGFGVVYRGVIDETVRPGYQSVEVAIKQLNPNGYQGDREWLAEVSYLGQLSHPNLVKLIGYCCEDEHRLLVYEYMASGCLEKHLFRRMSATLTWLRRLKIALDAAKGISFLHGLDRPVIYRDFKTSNILLDSNFNAKLSDFGLAKLGPMGDQTHVSTRVMGTYGYAAPEYIMTGHLTARSDVYGFGVVLLEMLIGRRALDRSRPSREHNLVEWCRPFLNNNKKFLRILDARIDGQYSTKAMMRVANITYRCLSENPKGRPLMSQVVEILEGIYEQEAGHDMAMLAKQGAGVTLYEDPGQNLTAPPKKKSSAKNNNVRKSAEWPKRDVRSRSEPANDIFGPPPGRLHTHGHDNAL